jgi:tetratricopeptide (TPR) repeat protein
MRWLLVWGALAATASGLAQQIEPAEPPAERQTRNSATPAEQSRAEQQFATGLRLAGDNKVDAAIAIFTGLIRDYPRLREPYQQLAALHAKRGDLQRAVIALQTAVKLGVQDAQLQEQLGDLYVELAANAYREALQAEQRGSRLRNKYSIIQSVNPPPVPPGARPP